MKTNATFPTDAHLDVLFLFIRFFVLVLPSIFFSYFIPTQIETPTIIYEKVEIYGLKEKERPAH